MINSTDVIRYHKYGFDWEKYIKLQKEKILERIGKFSGWRLYLEIGGKFLYDQHAARVLPGFIPESKKTIFSSLKDQAEILFCVSADDILADRQLSNEDIPYKEYVYRMIKAIEKQTGIKPHIVINKIDVVDRFDMILDFEKEFQRKEYRVWERYKIMGYPHNMKSILSEDGYWNDDHIPVTKDLILVTGAASSSGKMSTCLGQIYNDNEIEIKSGYAKYETFPIWNLPLEHPINLAYEAATADIEDYNMLDPYHKKQYGKDSVNYNRDVEGFEIVMGIAKSIVAKDSYMNKYKSPTDMGISNAGFTITDDEVCSVASLQEIRRRKERYKQMVERGEGEQSRIESCDELEKKCLTYIEGKKYKIDIKLD